MRDEGNTLNSLRSYSKNHDLGTEARAGQAHRTINSPTKSQFGKF